MDHLLSTEREPDALRARAVREKRTWIWSLAPCRVGRLLSFERPQSLCPLFFENRTFVDMFFLSLTRRLLRSRLLSKRRENRIVDQSKQRACMALT